MIDRKEQLLIEFVTEARKRIRGMLARDRLLLDFLVKHWEFGETKVEAADALTASKLNVLIQLDDTLSVLSVMLRLSRFTYRREGMTIYFNFPSLEKKIAKLGGGK